MLTPQSHVCRRRTTTQACARAALQKQPCQRPLTTLPPGSSLTSTPHRHVLLAQLGQCMTCSRLPEIMICQISVSASSLCIAKLALCWHGMYAPGICQSLRVRGAKRTSTDVPHVYADGQGLGLDPRQSNQRLEQSACDHTDQPGLCSGNWRPEHTSGARIMLSRSPGFSLLACCLPCKHPIRQVYKVGFLSTSQGPAFVSHSTPDTIL